MYLRLCGFVSSLMLVMCVCLCACDQEARVTSFSAPPSVWNSLYAVYKARVDIAVRKLGEAV